MRLRTAVLLLALCAALLGGVGVSGATFSGSSGSGQSSVSSGDYVPPTVTFDAPAAVGATATLTATATDTPGSGVASVRFERAAAGSTTWTTICVDTTAPYSCTWTTTSPSVAEGEVDLRAVATDGVGQTATDVAEGVLVDRTAPSSVSVTDPGTPVAGVVDLKAAAADADSGVASVTLQRAPTGTTAWTTICTDADEPHSCKWDTSALANGSGWDLRAIATDVAGNSRTSATVANRRVDNSKPTITLDDPGADLRGTVTLTANPVSSTGIGSVAIQRQLNGSTTWTTICTRTTTPWTCAWDTTTVAAGVYDLRAVMVTAAGQTVTSATVQDRVVDNAPLRGVDVQAVNRTGGTAGRIEAGDQLVLTYSGVVNPTTLVPGWSGAAGQALTVRLRDSTVAGTASDQLQLLTTGGAATGLGTVLLRSNLITSLFGVGGTASFAATASIATVGGQSVVTITIGTQSGGLLRTSSTQTTPQWTPSATAKDLGGQATATTTVTGSGSGKRVF